MKKRWRRPMLYDKNIFFLLSSVFFFNGYLFYAILPCKTCMTFISSNDNKSVVFVFHQLLLNISCRALLLLSSLASFSWMVSFLLSLYDAIWLKRQCLYLWYTLKQKCEQVLPFSSSLLRPFPFSLFPSPTTINSDYISAVYLSKELFFEPNVLSILNYFLHYPRWSG
jgi:hypothetical protein